MDFYISFNLDEEFNETSNQDLEIHLITITFSEVRR